MFVFVVTQLTTVAYGALHPDRDAIGGLVRVMMLGVIWWMYGGYAWLTNVVAPTDGYRRGLLLLVMAGFLIIALAVPQAFAGAGWVFGAGYMLVNIVHSGLLLHSGGAAVRRNMRWDGPVNLVLAGLVLAGGLAAVHWRYVLWALALGVQIISPYLHPIADFQLSPTHFVEWHGLVLIIVLGESVVAIGVGVAGMRLDAN